MVIILQLTFEKSVTDNDYLCFFSCNSAGEDLRKQSTFLVRYPNDIRTSDIARTSPRTRRSLEISHNCIREQKKKIAGLQQQLRRAQKKIRSLEDALKDLRQKSLLTSNLEEQLMVLQAFTTKYF